MGLIKKVNSLEIWESDRHGKAVKGKKKTSSIQVRGIGGVSGGYLLFKQYSFSINDPVKKELAIQKAEKFANEMPF
jgi:hypothetical protein